MQTAKRPEIKVGMFYYFCCICDLQLIKTVNDVQEAYNGVDDWFDEYGVYGKFKFFDTWEDVAEHFKGYNSEKEINEAGLNCI